jgi:hypothetical protein
MKIFDNVGFYIFSHKRADKQITYSELPYAIKRRTKFVVYKDEVKDYSQYENVIAYDGEYGIGYKRQFIMETAPEKYIFQMDDDCTFAVRKKGKLIRAKKLDVMGMFMLLIRWIKHERLGQVGMSFRGLNFTQEVDFQEVQNVYSVWCIDRELFNKLGLRCDHAPLLTDMQITLGLISSGYKNRVSYKYAVHQTPGRKGGCATYRSREKQAESVLKVHELFPKFTKVFKRKPKDEDWRVYDLKVRWKDAYRIGEAKQKYGNRKITDML